MGESCDPRISSYEEVVGAFLAQLAGEPTTDDPITLQMLSPDLPQQWDGTKHGEYNG